MRQRYIICYDIADDKRLRQVFKTMKGFGESLQYSVFCCDLSNKDRVRLEARLSEIIHHREDKILVVHAGPSSGRGKQCLSFLGQPGPPPDEHESIIV